MDGSWFFDENFNGVSDDFFDDVVKQFDNVNGGYDVLKTIDFPLEDVEGNNTNGEDWSVAFQSLEPPPASVLASFSSGMSGVLCGDSSAKNVPHDRSSQLNVWSNTAKASSSGSILYDGNSTDVKDSNLFQTSSPVSVLESSSSCSGENQPPFDSILKFAVKGTRSKRRRASTFNMHFTFPLAPSSKFNALIAWESESESHLSDKSSKKRQKKKKNLTMLSGSSESKKSPQQLGPVRKCMHCEVTKTPQWREGPMGPKTLCNACGVRYRSGRLVPEYRPAASPTFVASLHSNSHKKVVEIRKKSKLQSTMPMMHTASLTRPESSFT